MIVTGVEGQWSIKDMLMHILVWEKRMVQWVHTALRGEVPEMLPPGLTWDDLDVMNQQTYDEYRETPLAQALSEFRQSFAEAVEVVESIPEDDLLDPDRFPWRQGKPLWQIVAANTFWHYKEHDQTIRAWIKNG